jgi:alpha-L-rhamnosidase
VGEMDAFFSHLAFWFDLSALGFKTVLESPEPSRSDCHAWGAHPIYHYFTSILGARPAAPGLSQVRISPQPGPLTALHGAFPHTNGEFIRFNLHVDDKKLTGEISLPSGVTGTFVWQGKESALLPGRNQI